MITRRGFLAGAAATVGATACGLFGDGPRRLYYGDSGSQFVHLYEPDSAEPWPVIVTIHGGAWRDEEGLSILEPVAEDLVDRGFAVWNVEYRRVGEPGGGWPGTFDDIGRAVDLLANPPDDVRLDADRALVLGHSAGGHLALWAASRGNLEGDAPGADPEVLPRHAFSLAGIPDLVACAEQDLVEGACTDLMGAAPDEEPERYAIGSPSERLPLGVPQTLIHGLDDDVVPTSMSSDYAAAAVAAGDLAAFVPIPNAGHFALIDPEHPAWAEVARRVSGSLS